MADGWLLWHIPRGREINGDKQLGNLEVDTRKTGVALQIIVEKQPAGKEWEDILSMFYLSFGKMTLID